MRFSAIAIPALTTGAHAAVRLAASMAFGGGATVDYFFAVISDQPGGTQCDLPGATDSRCSVDGWEAHIVASNGNGCNNHAAVESGDIKTPDGEVVIVQEDSRCHPVNECDSGGLGGASLNGWECDI